MRWEGEVIHLDEEQTERLEKLMREPNPDAAEQLAQAVMRARLRIEGELYPNTEPGQTIPQHPRS